VVTDNCLKRKVFLKNQKHQPNIVEITHLCIMHRVHTSITYAKYLGYIVVENVDALLLCNLIAQLLYLSIKHS